MRVPEDVGENIVVSSVPPFPIRVADGQGQDLGVRTPETARPIAMAIAPGGVEAVVPEVGPFGEDAVAAVLAGFSRGELPRVDEELDVAHCCELCGREFFE